MAEPTNEPRKSNKRLIIWIVLAVVALIVLLFLM